MERYCQNPLCENKATKVVAVSVDKPSDQQRSLCAICEEAYSWGVQHGCMTATPKKLWIAAVTHRGDVVHAEALAGRVKAVKALAKYLETEEGYDGPADLPNICAWLAEHDERLGIEIFCASVHAAGDKSCSLSATCNPNARRGLVIDPPPQEKGAEPLYRIVYAIDVNARTAHQAAERAHEIMMDAQSMRPVLYILDGENTQTVVDLASESSQALDGSQADESQTKACRFVQANGTRCPQCNSREIDFGVVELDARCAYQEAYCRSCQVRFCAVYRLAGYGLHIGDSFEVHTLPGDHTAARDDDQ